MKWLAFLLFLLAGPVRAQSLLLNGDFEEENLCSGYKQNCAPEAWLNTIPTHPYFFEDAAIAYHGSRYIAVSSGNERMRVRRDFMRSRLLCGMRPGARYQLRFYIRAEFEGLIDSTGVQFSPYDMLCSKKLPRELEASFYLADTERTPARKGWVRVTHTYTARGNEGYFTIGNFRKLEWGTRLGGSAERYQVAIDSISLLPVDPYERWCRDWPQQKDTIYAEDYRHDYQIRRMYSCSKTPPPPLVLPPNVLVRVDTIVIPDVLFATNSADLDKRALLLLDSLSRRVPPGLDSVIVEGHTDNVGSDALNNSLSEARALSVGRYLEYGHDVPVRTRGYGSTRPVADNRTAGGRRLNRRVEIYLYFRY